jgi:transcription-repair coupling factor (superfamily II helicase)
VEITSLHTLFCSHPSLAQTGDLLSSASLHLTGLTGSSTTLVTSLLCRDLPGPHIFILPDHESAAYFYSDLSTLTTRKDLFFFPSSYKRAIQYGRPDPTHIVLRTEVLNHLAGPGQGGIVVTYPEALAETVTTPGQLRDLSVILHVGEQHSMSRLEEKLKELQFREVDFVQEPGEFSIRGGIMDIFSFASEIPARIDFLGNMVNSIRSIDLDDQLTKSKLDQYAVIPNIISSGLSESGVSFLEVLPASSILWSNCFGFIADKLDKIVTDTGHTLDLADEWGTQVHLNLVSGEKFLQHLPSFRIVDFSHHPTYPPECIRRFQTAPQPVFNKNFNLLADHMHQHIDKGYSLWFLTDNPKQVERLSAIFQDLDRKVHFTTVHGTLHEGFIDHDLKACFYTDHQIFDRYHKYHLRQTLSRRSIQGLKEIHDLRPGDYVVHVDHGIGIFGGLEKIVNNNKPQEAVRLIYKDNDILYVSIHSLHKIAKYRAGEGSEPRISKLGTGAWQNLKDRTKKKIKDIARDLIRLYARRKIEEGFAFSPDTYLQQELEASFMYEDTPDQLSATQAAKEGMEAPYAMDRLICGDVGFGKTEVAIRAAFKAVTDSKQVIVLVPTTILALQHYNTFSERLRNFPCSVDYVSRLKKPAQVKESLRKLAEGKTDIIIGTHKLLGKEVKMKNLGLLIIDEEQKFGVASKEKLKNLKVNVDTLTLTATPIPRTLQFSLMGARDLSVINTPPPNRHPIVTELHSLNEQILREGIEHEVARNGQVFFIHNRVQNIHEVREMIQRIVPQAKTAVAHGQMEGEKLEKVMLEFIRGDYDVLVATAIIESGLDIPNANTIFINNAHQFGLSDLHQLRGRVGRSNRKAYCYLLAPPLSTLTREARRRLQAVEEFSDLGSGFHIAMQDLDIRGAGNLLGAEQSGFIAEIGFETYQKILHEAIQELKEQEFREMLSQPAEKEKMKEEEPETWVGECTVDTDFEILLPEEYIPNITERMRLYRELDSISREEGLQTFALNLADRFGPPPAQTTDLMNIVRLRWLATRLGFEKIILKNSQAIIHFISNPLSPYFRSAMFSSILGFVQREPRRFRMKEGAHKLTLTVPGITSVQEALSLLEKMEK